MFNSSHFQITMSCVICLEEGLSSVEQPCPTCVMSVCASCWDVYLHNKKRHPIAKCPCCNGGIPNKHYHTPEPVRCIAVDGVLSCFTWCVMMGLLYCSIYGALTLLDIHQEDRWMTAFVCTVCIFGLYYLCVYSRYIRFCF